MQKKSFLHRSHLFPAEQGGGGLSTTLLLLSGILVTNIKEENQDLELPVIPLSANLWTGFDILFCNEVGDK